MKKKLTMIAALALAVCIGVGGTMAYLTAKTSAITNTFTIGGIALTLTETEGVDKGNNTREFTLVPGQDVAKNPKVQVTKVPGDSYVFVKIEKGADVDSYYTYNINMYDETTNPTGWKALTDGVYYREVSAADSAAVSVLAGDKVTTLGTVNGIADGANLNLTFTAYAIQKAGFSDANAAWTAGNKTASEGGWLPNP